MKKLILFILIAISVKTFSQVQLAPDKVTIGAVTINIPQPDTTTTYTPLMTEYYHNINGEEYFGFKTNLGYYYIVSNYDENNYMWIELGKLSEQRHRGSQVFEKDNGTLVYLSTTKKGVLKINTKKKQK